MFIKVHQKEKISQVVRDSLLDLYDKTSSESDYNESEVWSNMVLAADYSISHPIYGRHVKGDAVRICCGSVMRTPMDVGIEYDTKLGTIKVVCYDNNTQDCNETLANIIATLRKNKIAYQLVLENEDYETLRNFLSIG